MLAVALRDSGGSQAEGWGASNVVNSGDAGWKQELMPLTEGGLGVDVAIEAVGIPLTFQMATEIIRVGGTVAKDIAITTGLVSATTTPMLLRLVAQGKLSPERLVSHHFTFDKILDAYDTFGHAAETKALKVIITR